MPGTYGGLGMGELRPSRVGGGAAMGRVECFAGETRLWPRPAHV